MLNWIKITGVPEDYKFLCWSGVVLPCIDLPCDSNIVIDAFSGNIYHNDDEGFMVATNRALNILCARINPEIALEMRDHFKEDVFPYVFFSERCCTQLMDDELPSETIST